MVYRILPSLNAFFLLFLLIVTGAQGQSKAIEESILNDKESFYYIDFKNYPALNAAMPIGIFDSGTGGLTVLDAVVNFDNYNNKSGKEKPDGISDFSREDFIYLADQANMPYGNYAAVGKTDLLKEHIIKDTQFLLGSKYYHDNRLYTDKKPVKILVIACNTATAYGKTDVENFLKKAGSPVKVIGVIDAGSRGALSTFKKNESGSIGIFATAGTVASNGYETALKNLIAANAYTGKIKFFSQGGVGLAEAIDEDLNYIDRKAQEPRSLYKGPGLTKNDLAIQKALLDIYNFDFSAYKMLCDANDPEQCNSMQINSPENYVRFHLVSLLEKMRATPGALPLKVLILGCTHYPFLTEEIEKVLTGLRKVKTDGKYRYKHLLAKKVNLINPAINTAEELFTYLSGQQLLNKVDKKANGDFFISIPNQKNGQIITEENGSRFIYDYKYGRMAGEVQEYIQVVPFSRANIPVDVKERIHLQIPKTDSLIKNSANHRLLPEAEKW